MSYDPKCYELARHFLESDDRFRGREDFEILVEELAQHVQTTVELYCDYQGGGNS